MNHRTLKAGQTSQIWLGGPSLADPTLVFETDALLVEAPNWSVDGSLLVNANGRLWSLDPTSPDPRLVPIVFTGLPPINNDHVLDPDGEHVFMSASDGHIYRGAIRGSTVERVTPDDRRWHYLHGVSPDGTRLAYVEIGGVDEPGRLAVMPLGGSPKIIDTGDGHVDGPEFSPDGAFIYLNTEAFTDTPGHAQLARVDASGDLERLASSGTVDWFPHLSPDAGCAAYIAFPLGTLGHPADLEVEVRLVATSDWSAILQRYPLFGGQGTINVNSWSPDSTRFAFVAYPQS